MQYDLEHGMPTASETNPDTTQNDISPAGKGSVAQLAAFVHEDQHPHMLHDIGSLEESAQKSQAREIQGIRRRQKLLPAVWHLITLLGDGILLLSLLALSLVLASYLHRVFHVPNLELGSQTEQLVWGCLALVSWGMATRATQAQELVSVSSRLRSPLCTLFAIVLMIIFWTGLTYLFVSGREASYFKLSLLFLILAVPALISWRVALTKIILLPRFRHQAVIVGANTAGETIAKELKDAKYPSANVLGYISDGTEKLVQKDGLPILGGRSALRRLRREGMIDLIIMAIDYKTSPALFQEAIEAAQQGIATVPMSILYERTSGKIPVEHVGDHWYMALPLERNISPLYLCWQKVVDIVFGLIGTLILLLVLPVLALLIYLDSPGPIFYHQERLGHWGGEFSIFKFRSMRVDAEQAGQGVWASAGDPRVIRIGRLLRATHLDELPQTLNILRGEMSLIGPRPERDTFVKELEKTIPFYRCRLSVKPGLTGWAQVKYPYASTAVDALAKVQYDLYYIKHQSIKLDILIILKTVLEVLFCRGT